MQLDVTVAPATRTAVPSAFRPYTLGPGYAETYRS